MELKGLVCTARASIDLLPSCPTGHPAVHREHAFHWDRTMADSRICTVGWAMHRDTDRRLARRTCTISAESPRTRSKTATPQFIGWKGTKVQRACVEREPSIHSAWVKSREFGSAELPFPSPCAAESYSSSACHLSSERWAQMWIAVDTGAVFHSSDWVNDVLRRRPALQLHG